PKYEEFVAQQPKDHAAIMKRLTEMGKKYPERLQWLRDNYGLEMSVEKAAARQNIFSVNHIQEKDLPESWQKEYNEHMKAGIEKFVRRTIAPSKGADDFTTLDWYAKVWKPVMTVLGLKDERAGRAMDQISGELLTEQIARLRKMGAKGDHEFKPYYFQFADAMMRDPFRAQWWKKFEDQWEERRTVPISYRFLIGVLAERASEGSVEDLMMQFGEQMPGFDTLGPEWLHGPMLSPGNRSRFWQQQLYSSTNPLFPELGQNPYGLWSDDVLQLVEEPSLAPYSRNAKLLQELKGKVFWDASQKLPNIKFDDRYVKVVEKLKSWSILAAKEGEKMDRNPSYFYEKGFAGELAEIKGTLGQDPFFRYYFNRNFNPRHLYRLKTDELYARESEELDRYLKDVGFPGMFDFFISTIAAYERAEIVGNLRVSVIETLYYDGKQWEYIAPYQTRYYMLPGGTSVLLEDLFLSGTVEVPVYGPNQNEIGRKALGPVAQRRLNYDPRSNWGDPSSLPIAYRQFLRGLAQNYANAFDFNQGNLYEKFQKINPKMDDAGSVMAPDVTKAFRVWFNNTFKDFLDEPIDPNDPFFIMQGTQGWPLPNFPGPVKTKASQVGQKPSPLFSLRQPSIFRKNEAGRFEEILKQGPYQITLFNGPKVEFIEWQKFDGKVVEERRELHDFGTGKVTKSSWYANGKRQSAYEYEFPAYNRSVPRVPGSLDYTLRATNGQLTEKAKLAGQLLREKMGTLPFGLKVMNKDEVLFPLDPTERYYHNMLKYTPVEKTAGYLPNTTAKATDFNFEFLGLTFVNFIRANPQTWATPYPENFDGIFGDNENLRRLIEHFVAQRDARVFQGRFQYELGPDLTEFLDKALTQNLEVIQSDGGFVISGVNDLLRYETAMVERLFNKTGLEKFYGGEIKSITNADMRTDIFPQDIRWQMMKAFRERPKELVKDPSKEKGIPVEEMNYYRIFMARLTTSMRTLYFSNELAYIGAYYTNDGRPLRNITSEGIVNAAAKETAYRESLERLMGRKLSLLADTTGQETGRLGAMAQNVPPFVIALANDPKTRAEAAEVYKLIMGNTEDFESQLFMIEFWATVGPNLDTWRILLTDGAKRAALIDLAGRRSGVFANRGYSSATLKERPLSAREFGYILPEIDSFVKNLRPDEDLAKKFEDHISIQDRTLKVLEGRDPRVRMTDVVDDFNRLFQKFSDGLIAVSGDSKKLAPFRYSKISADRLTEMDTDSQARLASFIQEGVRGDAGWEKWTGYGLKNRQYSLVQGMIHYFSEMERASATEEGRKTYLATFARAEELEKAEWKDTRVTPLSAQSILINDKARQVYWNYAMNRVREELKRSPAPVIEREAPGQLVPPAVKAGPAKTAPFFDIKTPLTDKDLTPAQKAEYDSVQAVWTDIFEKKLGQGAAVPGKLGARDWYFRHFKSYANLLEDLGMSPKEAVEFYGQILVDQKALYQDLGVKTNDSFRPYRRVRGQNMLEFSGRQAAVTDAEANWARTAKERGWPAELSMMHVLDAAWERFTEGPTDFLLLMRSTAKVPPAEAAKDIKIQLGLSPAFKTLASEHEFFAKGKTKEGWPAALGPQYDARNETLLRPNPATGWQKLKSYALQDPITENRFYTIYRNLKALDAMEREFKLNPIDPWKNRPGAEAYVQRYEKLLDETVREYGKDQAVQFWLSTHVDPARWASPDQVRYIQINGKNLGLTDAINESGLHDFFNRLLSDFTRRHTHLIEVMPPIRYENAITNDGAKTPYLKVFLDRKSPLLQATPEQQKRLRGDAKRYADTFQFDAATFGTKLNIKHGIGLGLPEPRDPVNINAEFEAFAERIFSQMKKGLPQMPISAEAKQRPVLPKFANPNFPAAGEPNAKQVIQGWAYFPVTPQAKEEREGTLELRLPADAVGDPSYLIRKYLANPSTESQFERNREIMRRVFNTLYKGQNVPFSIGAG
ncbi:MAG TPA: hypothetical protein VJC08_03480, partial [bacterium]|nr:hypothetical protein [bacterium]